MYFETLMSLHVI